MGLSVQHGDEGFGHVLEALHNVLAVVDDPVATPVGELLQRFFPLVQVSVVIESKYAEFLKSNE